MRTLSRSVEMASDQFVESMKREEKFEEGVAEFDEQYREMKVEEQQAVLDAVEKKLAAMRPEELALAERNMEKLDATKDRYSWAVELAALRQLTKKNLDKVRAGVSEQPSVLTRTGDTLERTADVMFPKQLTEKMGRKGKIALTVGTGAVVAYGMYRAAKWLFGRSKNAAKAGSEAADETKGGFFKKALVGLGVGSLAFGSWKLYSLYKEVGSLKGALKKWGEQAKEGGEIVAEKAQEGVDTVKEELGIEEKEKTEELVKNTSESLQKKATEEYFQASFPMQYDVVESVAGEEARPKNYAPMINEIVEKALLQDVNMKLFMDCISEKSDERYLALLQHIYGSDFESHFSTASKKQHATEAVRMLVLMIEKNKAVMQKNKTMYGAASIEDLSFAQALNFSKAGLSILQGFAQQIPRSFLEKLSTSPADVASLLTEVPNIDFSQLITDTSSVAIQRMLSSHVPTLPNTASEEEKQAYLDRLQKDAAKVATFFSGRDNTRISTLESELSAMNFSEDSHAEHIIRGVLQEVQSAADGSIQEQLLSAMLVPKEDADKKDKQVREFFTTLFASGTLTFKEAFDLYYLSKSGQASKSLLFLRGISLMRSHDIDDHGLILNRYLNFMSLAGSLALDNSEDLARYGLENARLELGNLGKYVRDKGVERTGYLGANLSELWDRYKSWAYGAMGLTAAGAYASGTRYRAVRGATAATFGEDVARVTSPRFYSIRRLPLVGDFIADIWPGNYSAYRYIDEFENNGRGVVMGSIDWLTDRLSTPSRLLFGNGKRVSVLQELATADVDLLHKRFLKRLPAEIRKNQIDALQDLAKKAMQDIDEIGKGPAALRSSKMTKVVNQYWRELANTIYKDFKGSITTRDIRKMVRPPGWWARTKRLLKGSPEIASDTAISGKITESATTPRTTVDDGGPVRKPATDAADAADGKPKLNVVNEAGETIDPKTGNVLDATDNVADAQPETVAKTADLLVDQDNWARALERLGGDLNMDNIDEFLEWAKQNQVLQDDMIDLLSKSKSAKSLLVGAAETGDITEINRILRAAKGTRSLGIMKVLGGVGFAGDALGAYMAYVDFVANKARLEQAKQTNNQALQDLYNRANLVYAAEGTGSIAGLSIGSVAIVNAAVAGKSVTAALTTAAGTSLMLPIAVATVAGREVYNRAEKVTETWSRTAEDWIRNLSSGELLEKLKELGPGSYSYWQGWGTGTVAEQMARKAFTSRESYLEWEQEGAETIADANAGARLEITRAYVLRTSMLPKRKEESDAEYQQRFDQYVMDQMYYLGQRSGGTYSYQLAEGYEQARDYAELVAKSRELQTAGESERIEWTDSEGKAYEFDLADYETLTFDQSDPIHAERVLAEYRKQEETKKVVQFNLMEQLQNDLSPEQKKRVVKQQLLLQCQDDLNKLEGRISSADFNGVMSSEALGEAYARYVAAEAFNDALETQATNLLEAAGSTGGLSPKQYQAAIQRLRSVLQEHDPVKFQEMARERGYYKEGYVIEPSSVRHALSVPHLLQMTTDEVEWVQMERDLKKDLAEFSPEELRDMCRSAGDTYGLKEGMSAKYKHIIGNEHPDYLYVKYGNVFNKNLYAKYIDGQWKVAFGGGGDGPWHDPSTYRAEVSTFGFSESVAARYNRLIRGFETINQSY